MIEIIIYAGDEVLSLKKFKTEKEADAYYDGFRDGENTYCDHGEYGEMLFVRDIQEHFDEEEEEVIMKQLEKIRNES